MPTVLLKHYWLWLVIVLIILSQNCLIFARGINDSIQPDSLLHRDESGSENPDNRSLTLALSYLYGVSLAYSKEMTILRGTYPRALQLSLSWLQNTRETWDDCHCYPRIGLFLDYYNYDSPVLQHGYAAGLNLTYFLGLPGAFNFILSGRAGLAYLSNPYDRRSGERPYSELLKSPGTNLVYSSHFNYLLALGFGVRVELDRNLEIQVLTGMNHFSNASLTEPTSGINFPGVSLGLATTFNPVTIKPRNHPDPYPDSGKKKRWDIILSGGIANMPFPDQTKVSFYSLNLLHSRQIHRMGAGTLGVEVERDGRAKLEMDRGQRPDNMAYRGSMHIGYEFLMGRTILGLQLGYYLFGADSYRRNQFYQRYGAVYRVFRKISLGLSYKGIGHYADHLDLRISYSFN